MPGPSDPGADSAGQRAADVAAAAAEPLQVPSGGRIRVGTASWTDPTMTASGVFYPAGATTAEERLQHYAATFPLVEVDATYYALPAATTAQLWVERTPPDFTFDIKAHALMTGQGTETKRLPKAIKSELPESVASKTRIYAKDLPAELLDAVWAAFRDGLEPLETAGSSDRSCSSTRAGSSRRPRTARRSRTPSSGSTAGGAPSSSATARGSTRRTPSGP